MVLYFYDYGWVVWVLSVNINKSDRVGRVTLAESEQCLIFIRHQQQLGSRAMITVLSTIFNITFIIAAHKMQNRH